MQCALIRFVFPVHWILRSFSYVEKTSLITHQSQPQPQSVSPQTSACWQVDLSGCGPPDLHSRIVLKVYYIHASARTFWITI